MGSNSTKGIDVEKMNEEEKKLAICLNEMNTETNKAEGIKKANFEDDILNVIKPMGRFQVRVLVWGYVIEALVGFCVMFFLFGGDNPGFTCYDDVEGANTTYNISHDFASTCDLNRTQCSSRRYNTEEFTSIITEWDLVCEKQITVAYISMGFMVGMFLGASVFGLLADMYGRKKVTFAVFFCMMLCHTASMSATCWQLMLFFRLLSGIFAGGVLVVNFTIPMEIIDSYWRGICVTLGGFPLGICLLTLMAYFIRDWRHLAMLSGLCCLPLLLCWFIIPESPRWLIQKGRFEEAESVLKWMASVNGRPEPNYNLLPKLCAAYTTESELGKNYSYLDLFRTKQMTISTYAMCLYWFTAAVSYYGIAMNTKELNGDRYINAVIMAVLEQIFNLSVIVATSCFGRRRCGAGYLFIGALCLYLMVAMEMVPSGSSTTYIRSALSLLGRAALSGAWCIAFLFTLELFPTLIRNTAYGGCSMAARVGGVLSPYIAHLHFVHPTIPYLIVGTLAFTTGTVTLLLLPETKGKPMPDMMPDKTGRACVCCGHVDSTVIDDDDINTVQVAM